MIKLSKFMASTTSTLTSIYAEHVTMAEKIGKCMPNLNEKSKRLLFREHLKLMVLNLQVLL